MNIVKNAQDKLDQWMERIAEYLAKLSLRERIMVITAAVLLTSHGPMCMRVTKRSKYLHNTMYNQFLPYSY